MEWIVLYSPSNFEAGLPPWRVTPMQEHIGMNLKALISKNPFCDWHVVSNVFKSFDEALIFLDELKERIDWERKD